MKQAVLSLSGGMDSSTVLLHLLAKGYEVTAVSFDYGQKHRVELERAQSLVDYINGQLVLGSNESENPEAWIVQINNFEEPKKLKEVPVSKTNKVFI